MAVNFLDLKQERFSSLDGLRGLAALIVFFSHFVGIYEDSQLVSLLNTTFLRGFWDGASAVILFFVLSGFVLSASVKRGGSYFSYIIKRCFRIYPAYIVVLFVAVFFQIYFFDPLSTKIYSHWFSSFWQEPISYPSFIRHMTLLLHVNTRDLNPSVWTMFVELKLSLVVPVLLLSTRRFTSISALILWFLSMTAFFYILQLLGLGIFYWAQFFLVGVFLFRLSRFEIYHYASPTLDFIFFVFGLFLFASRYGLGLTNELADCFASIGSVLLISVAIRSTWFCNFLNLSPLAYLGKVSYSFYLLHFPVLLVVAGLFSSYSLSCLFIFFGALSFTLLLAHFLYIYVEKYFMLLGSKLSQYCLSKNYAFVHF